MRTRSLAIVAVLLCSCKSGCGQAQPEDTTGPSSSNPKLFAVDGVPPEPAARRNVFAYELYRQMHADDGKFVIAPATLGVGLGMAFEGAKGQTAAQIANVLHLDRKAPSHEQLAGLEELWGAGKGEGIQLKASNQLWVDKSLSLTDSFKDSLRSYKASVQQVDFAGSTEPSRETINRWASEQTGGKVADVIWKGGVDPSTRILMTSVAYFSGRWRSSFDPARTHMVPFEYIPGTDAMTPTMAQTASFPYAELDVLQLLEMPTDNDNVSMVFLLPKRGHRLAEVEAGLDNGKLQSWLNRTTVRELDVYLPKFVVSGHFGLAKALTDLNMPLAFGLQADFAKLASNANGASLMVIHRAVVEVGEGGKPPAANATPPDVHTDAASQRTRFQANHPFVFVVRERKAGTILMLGRYTRP